MGSFNSFYVFPRTPEPICYAYDSGEHRVCGRLAGTLPLVVITCKDGKKTYLCHEHKHLLDSKSFIELVEHVKGKLS